MYYVSLPNLPELCYLKLGILNLKKKLSRQCVGMLTLLSQCLPKLPEHA